MKFVWMILMPVVGFSPAVMRYLRIQGNTNPFLKEVCCRTTGKIVASFIPIHGPMEDILKDTLYECIENRTLMAEYVAKHLLLQCLTHEINDGVHELWKKVTH